MDKKTSKESHPTPSPTWLKQLQHNKVPVPATVWERSAPSMGKLLWLCETLLLGIKQLSERDDFPSNLWKPSSKPSECLHVPSPGQCLTQHADAFDKAEKEAQSTTGNDSA